MGRMGLMGRMRRFAARCALRCLPEYCLEIQRKPGWPDSGEIVRVVRRWRGGRTVLEEMDEDWEVQNVFKWADVREAMMHRYLPREAMLRRNLPRWFQVLVYWACGRRPPERMDRS